MKLIVATEEEKRARDLLTHQAWGQGLSPEAFCQREIRLRAHRWCREAMTTWLWKNEASEVLASCETFRMRSRADGKESVSFGVASVFTEPALRGRGHALAMMRALGERLRRDEPRAHGVLLFSEVGAELYRRAGYVPRAFVDRLVEAKAGVAPAETRWLTEAEVPEALARFPLPAERFVVWPDAAQIDWHLERARIYADLLGRQLPAWAGAEVGEARALWSADFKNGRLAVLLATAPDAVQGAAVIDAARHAAATAGLREVRLWETPSLPLPPALGERISRDADALPMLLSFQEVVRAEDWNDVPRALWV